MPLIRKVFRNKMRGLLLFRHLFDRSTYQSAPTRGITCQPQIVGVRTYG